MQMNIEWVSVSNYWLSRQPVESSACSFRKLIDWLTESGRHRVRFGENILRRTSAWSGYKRKVAVSFSFSFETLAVADSVGACCMINLLNSVIDWNTLLLLLLITIKIIELPPPQNLQLANVTSSKCDVTLICQITQVWQSIGSAGASVRTGQMFSMFKTCLQHFL